MTMKGLRRKTMGAVEYMDALSELGVSRSWVGRTLATSEVTGRRWVITSRIPDSAAIIIRLMRAGVITRADVEAAKSGATIRPVAIHRNRRCESQIS